MIEKLQKRVCSSVGPTLAASVEPFSHRGNVASLRFFLLWYMFT